MYNNTYPSSILSVRTCFSINDYSCYSNEKCPSSYCSCCCSNHVSLSRLILPINPSFLFGLRQSTLIHLSPSRRLVLGSENRVRYRGPVYDVGRRYSDVSCCVNEERVGDKCCVKDRIFDVSKKVRGRGRGRVDRRGSYRCGALGEAEAMLSLLADESVEECLEVREKRRSAGKEGKIVRKRVFVSERDGDRKSRKEDVGRLCLGSEVNKLGFDRGRVQYEEEGRKRRERVESNLKKEDWRSRRRESTSSYYSVSDSGGFESDSDVEVKHEGFVGESSTSHGKDSRKYGGVVINEETKKDSKRYADERNEQVQGGILDHSRVGSSAEWDCRKKSEKKLAEVSSEETKSQLSQIHQSSSKKASSLIKQSNLDERVSSSGGNSHWQSWSHIKTNDGDNEYSKSSSRREQVTQMSINEAGTSTGRRSNVGEGALIVGKPNQEKGCEYCKECGSNRQEKKIQTEIQQHTEVSEFRNDETRVRKQVESSTSLQSSIEGTKQQEQTIHVTAGQVNTGRKSQYYNETVKNDDSYTESSLRSRRRSETRMKNLEEHSTSVLSQQEVKRIREESGAKIVKETEARKVSQTGLGVSQGHSTNVGFGSQSTSEQRIYDKQTFLTSRLESVKEAVEKHKQIEETMVQSTSKTQVQGHIRQEGFTGSASGEATVIQPSVTFISQTGVQQISKVDGKSDIHISVVAPSYQFIEGSHSQYGQSSTSAVKNDSVKVTEVGSSAAYVHPQVDTASSSYDAHGSGSLSYAESSQVEALGSATRMEETSIQIVGDTSGAYVHPQVDTASSSYDAQGSGSLSYEESSQVDALGSATRMEETSILIVGEFFEKMKHAASTSDIRIEKVSSQPHSNSEEEKRVETRLKKQSSKHSSGGSRTKGPSDEMWHVKDNVPRASSEMESLEGTPSEDNIQRKTGKSLWNVVSGVFRLRWGSHSETQKSPVKSGGRSSSNESASGEAWFSGNEHDEASSDSLRTEQSNIPQPTSSNKLSEQRIASTSGKEVFGVISLDERTKLVEEDASSSSSILLAGSLSGSVSAGTSTNPIVTQQIPQLTPSLKRSDAFEEIQETGRNKGAISSTREQRKHAIDVRQSSGSSSEGTDVELKRRKFQRSKHVPQDRYEAWEDAYQHEYEQRKVDEIFMKEALVEAKKASDSWEVPVGAVLVQNGNIIARGYNLVEELRDSTAHAEMICIREASSTLKTWRLSETTLYVTLEPCPMCAGAILQARVGTLVWGAPNKLLGADGSWIRLFTECAETEQRPEVTGKPAAPVHPFHPNMKI